MFRSVEERFWSKVQKGPGCWEWQAGLRNGYGAFRMGGVGSKVEQAHRAAWILLHGEIPEGKFVLHDCDNRKCVKHLYLGDQAQNMQDMKDRDRTTRRERHWSRRSPEKVRRGVDHHNTKLSPRDVTRICSEYKMGKCSQRQIAQRYGVSQTQVSRIVSGKRWAKGG